MSSADQTTSSVDHTEICVSGLTIHVYGTNAFRSSNASSADVVFLLHGRTGSYLDMEPWALAILAKAKSHQSDRPQAGRSGLLVVSFDHRNHGHREVHSLANQSWDGGNPLHAQDMYAIYHGTAADVSMLITMLPFCLFPKGDCSFANIICCGVSLGGHSTYVVLSNDDRVVAGVPVLGCPDYCALIIPRAGDKRAERLPQPFLDMVAKLEPKLEKVSKKDVLVLRGADDVLVPWAASEGFVDALPRRSTEVVAFAGVGHEFPDEMVERSAEWIVEWRERH